MIGDIVGRPGRRAVHILLSKLRQEYGLDLVVANGENAAGGFGITPETARELLDAGVDVITSGNHLWDQREILPYLDGEMPLLRPLNYPAGVPGRGYIVLKRAMVVNAIGRVFMAPLDCPFRAIDRLLGEMGQERPRVVLVDFHAEATSEKQALAWYLDGRVSAVLGTHTHVPTADPRILPKGTAAITDVGMVGPVNSIIGTDPRDALHRFLVQTPNRLTVPGGPVSFNSVMVEVDEVSGLAKSIQRIDRIVE